MVSSEVQRTLVKSPPELWAELSDPAALARHLGELGEIKITRTEPEKVVEWEAEGTTGKVTIKPSGWGTRVTLSVARELPPPEPAEDQHELAAVEQPGVEDFEPELAFEPEAEAVFGPEATFGREAAFEPELEFEPEAAFEPELEFEPEAAFEPELEFEPEVELAPEGIPELEPRRGFFARLFGRRWQRRAESTWPLEDASLAPEPPPEALEAEGWSEMELEELRREEAEERLLIDAAPSLSEPGRAAGEPEPSIAAEEAETTTVDEVTAVLTGVLDRLGAAHHRPFSRA